MQETGEGCEPTMPHGPYRDTPSADHTGQVGKPKPPSGGDGGRQVNENTTLVESKKPKVR